MNFVRVNMTTQNINAEPASPEYASLGGRGITSKLLSEEVNPRIFALGKDNKLVIAPGLLTGTTVTSSGRTSVGAKSPLTGTIKESNVGGCAGQYLSAHGIKAVVLEGAPAEKHAWVLLISEKENKLEINDNLTGLGNYETVNFLRQKYGSDSAVICIGPAGEAGAFLATVAVSDREGRPARHAGRGGMGAVMGSKGVKAIVISRPLRAVVQPKDSVDFLKVASEFAQAVVQSKKALTTYGTSVFVKVINTVGGLPTRNFSTGYNEHAHEIDGEKLYSLINERGGKTGHACSRGCVIRCSNIFHDAVGNYLTSGLEYETIALMGSNCGINDLDGIAQIDRLCDDLGIDTMEMGATLGVAMEAGVIPFGDLEKMKVAISSIVSGSYLGRILGLGAAVTGRVLWVERTPVVKGQSLSGYDPRALKGTGVTYATSTMGADHTTANCIPGRGGLDTYRPEGQVGLSRDLQVIVMVMDILGMCLFVGPDPQNIPVFASLVGAFTGQKVYSETLLDQARQILKLEMEFNREAGIGKEHNDLPNYFRTEPLPNNGLVFDVPLDELKEFDF